MLRNVVQSTTHNKNKVILYVLWSYQALSIGIGGYWNAASRALLVPWKSSGMGACLAAGPLPELNPAPSPAPPPVPPPRPSTRAGCWTRAGTSWPSWRTCRPSSRPSTTCVSCCLGCRPATTPSPPPPRWASAEPAHSGGRAAHPLCFSHGTVKALIQLLCPWRSEKVRVLTWTEVKNYKLLLLFFF